VAGEEWRKLGWVWLRPNVGIDCMKLYEHAVPQFVEYNTIKEN